MQENIKIDKTKLSDKEKMFLNAIEGLYKKSHGIYEQERNKELYELVKNKNFLNNQNYLISNKIKNHIYSIKDIREGSNNHMKNMIGYNKYLKIQEIDYKNIKDKRNNLKIFLFGFSFLFILGPIVSIFGGDKKVVIDDILGLIFILIFLSIFIYGFLYAGNLARGNLKIYRNKDKIIFYKIS